jgi:hypothetical protein
MRTKLIVLAAVTGVLMAGSASAEQGIQHCKRPLVARIVSVAFAKQPTLVQSQPAPRKPL